MRQRPHDAFQACLCRLTAQVAINTPANTPAAFVAGIVEGAKQAGLHDEESPPLWQMVCFLYQIDLQRLFCLRNTLSK
jgi:hypothetical protein